MEIEMNPATPHHHHHNNQQQQQEMSSQTLESMLVCNKAGQQEKKPRPAEQALKCPRCDSTNTKFCYYNNYSLTQPRYFCKSCRRYWTKGGTLRNVPVGGGCRKNNKRSSSSSSSSSSPSLLKRTQDPVMAASNPDSLISSLRHLPYESTTTDLSLAFARLQSQATGQLGFDHHTLFGNSNNNGTHGDSHFLGNPSAHGFLDALRGGFLENAPNGFHHNVYYGDSIGNIGEMGNVENGGTNVDVSEEMGFHPYHDQEHNMSSSGAATTAVAVTTVKQESCNGGRSEGESRVLWGFPWQIGGGEGNMVEIDSGRQMGWNNNSHGLGSTWHGLLNSPLM